MAFVIAATSMVATAAEPAFDRGPVLTVIEENDLVVKTDRHYTQGIKLSYFHSDGSLPLGSDWLYDGIPEVGFEKITGRLGYSIGQNIYTPANITDPRLQKDDRPYAGWLYVGMILQRRGWNWGRLAEEDFEFETGVIGEAALAEEAQTWVHQLRGFALPRGWKYQIRNEPGLRLKYSRAVRVYEAERDGFGFDVTPRAGTSLGNVDTSFRAGGIVRLGYNMPDDFGYRTIDSLSTVSGGKSKSHAQRWGVYVFAGVEGRVQVFNETLDGGILQDSHSVQREWLLGDVLAGFIVAGNWIEFGYTQTFRSPEFRGQTEHDSFGSVFATFRF